MSLNNIPEIGEDQPMKNIAPKVQAYGPKHAGSAAGAGAAVAGGTSKLKFIIPAVALCLVAGAGVAWAVISGQHTEETAPQVAEVATVKGTVKVNNLLVKGSTVTRGDVLTNVEGASDLNSAVRDNYYKAQWNGKTVYVEKSRVRLSTDAAYEEWTGYAAADAIIYKRSDLMGDDILTLSLNEEVTVLDELGDLLYVRNADGYEGYVEASKISHEKYEEAVEESVDAGTTYTAPTYNYNYNYNSGGNSGGNTGGGDTSTPATPVTPSTPSDSGTGSTTGDGDDISLFSSAFHMGATVAYAEEASTSSNEGTGSGTTATVLRDETQLYLAILMRGDSVEIASTETGTASVAGTSTQTTEATEAESTTSEHRSSEEDAEKATASEQWPSETKQVLNVNGNEVKVPARLIQLETDKAFEKFTGYATEDTQMFTGWELDGDTRDVFKNDELKIIDTIETAYIVQTDGGIFFIPVDKVSKEKAEEEEEEETEAEGEAAATTDTGATQTYNTYVPNNTNANTGGNTGGSTNETVTPTPETPSTPSNNGGTDSTIDNSDNNEYTPPKL